MQWVAAERDVVDDLGVKGKSGLLHTMASRAACLCDLSHWVVFHDTPTQYSWLNQVGIWLSILVRNVLKRGNVPSVDDLKQKVLAFIDYNNRTMAKPFKWMYQGRVLNA